MKVYFSTTSRDLDKARALMQRIRDAGHTITFDWTEGIDFEEHMSGAELSARAEADIEGVRQADIVAVYMQPKMERKMTGAAIEIGAAYALHTPVAVIEEGARFAHFFKYHPSVIEMPTFQAFLQHLEDLEQGAPA